jgi:hypothetical protein
MNKLRTKQKSAGVSRALSEDEKEKSRRAAASYSEVLRVVVRGVITMMPFSPLFLEELRL